MGQDEVGGAGDGVGALVGLDVGWIGALVQLPRLAT